ncbi:hypothetical protein RHMOL_Rhmol10G0169800 [Rhododendron molle]|uniref:Uncharacterized protein n=1 Tax=Rhododendron molle TaxID=49168 RepID=A0ACC0M3F5_RHOML|nr:hypothetical protein RHMOL_Rhmol10G0169800 [Rhododendron molle]
MSTDISIWHGEVLFVPSVVHPIHGQASEANVGVDLCPESKDLKQVDNGDSSCAKSTSTEDATGCLNIGSTYNLIKTFTTYHIGILAIRSVCMRDMNPKVELQKITLAFHNIWRTC